MAYVAEDYPFKFVVVDGQKGRWYDSIARASPIFSPDGNRVAYMARKGNKWRVVVDGEEGRKYDDIIAAIVFDSPDSLHYLAERDNTIYLVEERMR